MYISYGTAGDTASILGLVIGLPTIIASFYQSWKARQEARAARRELIFSEDCLEFVLDDGSFVNLVQLETLHSLPRPGDIVLLPGDGVGNGAGPYRVENVEFIYTREEVDAQQPRQARLTKTVAHVVNLLDV